MASWRILKDLGANCCRYQSFLASEMFLFAKTETKVLVPKSPRSLIFCDPKPNILYWGSQKVHLGFCEASYKNPMNFGQLNTFSSWRFKQVPLVLHVLILVRSNILYHLVTCKLFRASKTGSSDYGTKNGILLRFVCEWQALPTKSINPGLNVIFQM